MTKTQLSRPATETQTNVGRKYKSRKERPFVYSLPLSPPADKIPSCDACRKRKICCTRDAYEKDCSLCKTRGESCKYVLPPNVRRNRQPARPRASTSSSNSTASIPPRPVAAYTGNESARPSKGAASEWICQFVGLSGDQDPFVLR
jgi:Fungal Zn(2)-Cys(6) binuclear cluster domain